MQTDRAYVIRQAGADGSIDDYDVIAVPRGAVPIASILAVINAVIQYGPQVLDLIRKLIAAFTPVPDPGPTPQPQPVPPNPTPGPIPTF